MAQNRRHLNDNSSLDSSQDTFKGLPVGSIRLSGETNEYVIVGDKKYPTHEFMRAFGGMLFNQPIPPQAWNFGNPASLGLSAFAMTTFVLSMVNAGVLNIHKPQIVLGLSCFYGGAVQFAAGIWEFFLGNTFGSVALTLYGAFWLAYSSLFFEAFGVAAAYKGHEDQMRNAIGFFLLGWTLFSFMLFLVTLKSTVPFMSLFITLVITFIFLTSGELANNKTLTKVGGIFGIITSFIAWYNAWAGVATRQNSYFTYYQMPLVKRD
ncbi:hypothetical protein PUMCH_002637 [Australozyma saopauloensis]|uniref:Ammonia transport outward protein 2 n=1 Tax=Australozyma saopauloensis TaxID=291208 RepID=A0AAX4HAG9_9ASCO|nr:hypothetical protein PUMCH_002637 [[Candida] saopauloensis]